MTITSDHLVSHAAHLPGSESWTHDGANSFPSLITSVQIEQILSHDAALKVDVTMVRKDIEVLNSDLLDQLGISDEE